MGNGRGWERGWRCRIRNPGRGQGDEGGEGGEGSEGGGVYGGRGFVSERAVKVAGGRGRRLGVEGSEVRDGRQLEFENCGTGMGS